MLTDDSDFANRRLDVPETVDWSDARVIDGHAEALEPSITSPLAYWKEEARRCEDRVRAVNRVLREFPTDHMFDAWCEANAAWEVALGELDAVARDVVDTLVDAARQRDS